MDALGVLLAALGANLEGLPDADSRKRRYQTLLRGRATLVLLDNANSVDQVQHLLPPPPCIAAVTSRNELTGLETLANVCRIRLDGLTDSETAQLLRLLVGDREPHSAQALLGLALGFDIDRYGLAALAEVDPTKPTSWRPRCSMLTSWSHAA
jgi:hypothetical protein